MGLTARIAQLAGIAVRNVGSLELITSDDAEAFLCAARDKQTAVLGVEGFSFDGEKVVPDMNAIADFSELARSEDAVTSSLAEARRFMQIASRPSMYFDFTLEEKLVSR